MLDKLLERLEKERKVIKKTPWHFWSACVFAFVSAGILWFLAFSTALAIKSSTVQAYRERYGDLSSSPADDISKLFRIDTITNVVGGKQIVLDYEPVPQTVKIMARSPDRSAPISADEAGFSVAGKTITITNQLLLNSVMSLLHDSPGWSLQIEYARKSLR